MKNCIIVGAADFSAEKYKNIRKDYVIAADCGYKSLLSINENCNLFVGDGDSLGFFPQNCECIKLPVSKDDTDLLFAVKEGIKRGFDSFYLFGVIGGKRFSHTVSSLQTLLFAAKLGKNIKIIDDSCEITALPEGVYTFSGKGFFSLFSFDKTLVSISGAKFNLSDFLLENSNPVGQSNEFTEKILKIEVKNGIAVFIEEK